MNCTRLFALSSRVMSIAGPVRRLLAGDHERLRVEQHTEAAMAGEHREPNRDHD